MWRVRARRTLLLVVTIAALGGAPARAAQQPQWEFRVTGSSTIEYAGFTTIPGCVDRTQPLAARYTNVLHVPAFRVRRSHPPRRAGDRWRDAAPVTGTVDRTVSETWEPACQGNGTPGPAQTCSSSSTANLNRSTHELQLGWSPGPRVEVGLTEAKRFQTHKETFPALSSHCAGDPDAFTPVDEGLGFYFPGYKKMALGDFTHRRSGSVVLRADHENLDPDPSTPGPGTITYELKIAWKRVSG